MKTIVDEIKKVLEDAKLIETATDWTEFLHHDSARDSSMRSDKRMRFVRDAEAKFIELHKKEVLSLAAKLCRDSVGDIKELITIRVAE